MGFLPLPGKTFNLLGRFEFHKQQSIINIDEMISENRMVATESNRRSASLKISTLPFCGDSQTYPNTNTAPHAYRGPLNIHLGEKTAQGIAASGDYSVYGVDAGGGVLTCGIVNGVIFEHHDMTHSTFSLRFRGKWERTSGYSGGDCQYGQFYLDLSFGRLSKSTECAFTGFWTYCDDDPLVDNPSRRWIWYSL